MKGFLLSVSILLAVALFFAGIGWDFSRLILDLQNELVLLEPSLEGFCSEANQIQIRIWRDQWNKADAKLTYFVPESALQSVRNSLRELMIAAETKGYQAYCSSFYLLKNSLSELQRVAVLSREGVF